MANYLIRPTSYVSGNFATTNQASNAIVTTNLGDNSDATSVIHNSSAATNWDFGLATASVPTDEFIAKVGGWLRISGGAFNGTAYTYVGTRVYRTIDGVPSSVPTIAGGSGAPTSYETGQQNVDWTLSNLSGLRLRWYDGRTSSSTTATTYDVWGKIYTIKKPTATPVTTTITTTTQAVIQVDVAAVLDWEAFAPDYTRLREAGLEVRVESGGTGVGTGTLVTSQTTSTTFGVTGTNNLYVYMPDRLSNGTYNVYARAWRYRESQVSPLSDQYGAWSTAATLTMNVPAPNAPTASVSGDQTLDRILIDVSPQFTTGYTTPITIDVQRSIDSGTTWTNIRGGIAAALNRANLVPNPNFETNTTGWTGSANTTLARSTAQFQSGTASASLTAIAAGNVAISTPTGTSGIPVTAGRGYSFSYYMRPAAITGFTAQIDWYTAAGAFISSSSQASGPISALVWTRVAVSNATAPATAAFATLTAQMGSVAISSVNYIDSLQFEQASAVTNYSDYGGLAIYDYEMPRATGATYRVRTNAYYTTGLVTNYSAWTTAGGTTIGAVDWNIKVPENSALNIIDVAVIGDPAEQLTETMGVFRALDRQYPVVVAGTLNGYDGQLEIVTTTTAEWNALKLVLESQKVLLLESPFGWSKYIRLVGGADIRTSGSATTPRRTITASYVHVQAP